MASSARAPGVNVEILLDEALKGDLASLKLVLSDLDIRGPEGLAETLTRMTDKDGWSALHYAAKGRRGALRICRYLVEKVKLDVDIKDRKLDRTGNTPLPYAAGLGPKKLVQMLITKGADVKAKSKFGCPLHVAASEGLKDHIEVLLENHADPNEVSPDHITPLMLAISTLSVDCVKLLLEGEADANLTSLSGSTPLAAAAQAGSHEIVECLLKYGANPDAIDGLGLKPIMVGAIMGNIEVVEALLPVTTCIQTVVDWSADGIMKHVRSEEGEKEIMSMLWQHFFLSKSNGDEAFERKDYLLANFWYIE